MSAKRILSIAGGLVVVVIIFYSFFPGKPVPYEVGINQTREEIDRFMKFDQDSPLPDSIKSDFEGLQHYPPDPKYVVEATLERLPANQQLVVGTSDAKEKVYSKYAYAIFDLQGQTHRLLLLQSSEEDGEDILFLPFGDITNGQETYGGGRYLDLEFTNKSKTIIDFNLAYNPYCAYNPGYSCPLPPAENRLTIAIEAGETNFEYP